MPTQRICYKTYFKQETLEATCDLNSKFLTLIYNFIQSILFLQKNAESIGISINTKVIVRNPLVHESI